MKSIDDQLKFYLSRQGWYIDDTQISFEEIPDEFCGVPVIVSNLTDGGLCAYANGKIFISQTLRKFGTYPQIMFGILHEYAHKRLDLCGYSEKDQKLNHNMEYSCDLWALKNLIKSGNYNKYELYDAIKFCFLSNDGESLTHPSMRDRYKRLLNQLRESGL